MTNRFIEQKSTSRSFRVGSLTVYRVVRVERKDGRASGEDIAAGDIRVARPLLDNYPFSSARASENWLNGKKDL
jgi:hypothetical protein